MQIRPLTDVEIIQSNEAKRVANEVIKTQRHSLRLGIRYCRDASKLELQQKYKALKTITGKPVFIRQGDRLVLLDYELLQKLYKSIVRRHWPCEINVFNQPQKMLTLDYPIGSAKLYELPKYQEVLLTGLPVIVIEE